MVNKVLREIIHNTTDATGRL